MKITSDLKELEGISFKTVDECIAAEHELALQKEKARIEAEKATREAEVSKANLVSKRKKELSEIIKAADQELSNAHANLDKANEEVEKLKEEYKEKIKAILVPANKAVRQAEENKFNALMNFNREFGPYEIKCTGEDALAQYQRMVKDMRRIFNGFGMNF